MSWTTEWIKEKRLCTILECSNIHYARGWCRLHYNRIKLHGHEFKFKDGKARNNCQVENCPNVASIIGYCKKHYDQERHRNKPISAKANHEHHIKYRYGIPAIEYHRKLEDQNHACSICKLPENVIVNNKIIRLAVDHDHKTKAIRDLLCIRCNRVLGSVKDSPKLLKEMASYLNRHNINDDS